MSNRLVRHRSRNAGNDALALDNFHDDRGREFGVFNQFLGHHLAEGERFPIARKDHCAEVFRLGFGSSQRKAVARHATHSITGIAAASKGVRLERPPHLSHHQGTPRKRPSWTG